jgi:hypothetical protein
MKPPPTQRLAVTFNDDKRHGGAGKLEFHQNQAPKKSIFGAYFTGLFGNKVSAITDDGDTAGNPQDESVGNESKLDMLEKTDLDKRMMGRKSKGEDAHWYIIYPDDKFRARWDIIITM